MKKLKSKLINYMITFMELFKIIMILNHKKVNLTKITKMKI